MTTPTKEQCVAVLGYVASEDDNLLSNGCEISHDTLHAFALKVLAEKELEVLKLREAMEHTRSDLFLQIEAKHGAKAASEYPSIVSAIKALSTPPSTEALDEYVAARMAESEDRRDAERYRWLRNSWPGFNYFRSGVVPYLDLNELDKHIDAAIEAEKVRTE